MKIFYTICCILISMVTNAQSIKGIVVDEKGSPIAYCSVAIANKNSKIVTITNINGEFTLNNIKDSILSLRINAVGFQGKTIQIKKSEKLITIILETDNKTLYEVVVTQVSGYKGKKIKGKISNKFENKTEENNFKNTNCDPLSTFGIDDDKASYSYIRKLISKNKTVPADAVRIEEIVNYFDYNYGLESNKNPYNFFNELTTCPWNKEHLLLKLAIVSTPQKNNYQAPANYVFLIDVSGSMSGDDRLPLVKKSMLMLLDSLNENDDISIVTYAGASGIVLEPTKVKNKSEIINAINTLKPGGRTAGSEGINLAYEVAENNLQEGANNRIILATDGDFNLGITSYDKLEKLIEQKKTSGIFLTCLGFGTGNVKDKTMEILADKGNGNYYYISDTIEAKRVLQKDFKGTINTVAKDVKIQLEFNNVLVKNYRLLGYENRLLEKEDFKNDKKDGGELGEGHTVTVLYEIDLENNITKDSSTCKNIFSGNTDEIAIIKTRYKQPNRNKSKALNFTITKNITPFENATNNTKWAASVAMFGMLLQDSPFKMNSSVELILKTAKESVDINDELQLEFIELVKNIK